AAVAQLAPPLLPLSAALFAYTAIPSLTGAYNVLFKERRLGVAARPDVARNSMPPGEEVRFAVDSPVEEADSNRRSLPMNELVSRAGMRMRARRQGWSRTRRPCSGDHGFESAFSSAESRANLSLGARSQESPDQRRQGRIGSCGPSTGRSELTSSTGARISGPRRPVLVPVTSRTTSCRSPVAVLMRSLTPVADYPRCE